MFLPRPDRTPFARDAPCTWAVASDRDPLEVGELVPPGQHLIPLTRARTQPWLWDSSLPRRRGVRPQRNTTPAPSPGMAITGVPTPSGECPRDGPFHRVIRGLAADNTSAPEIHARLTDRQAVSRIEAATRTRRGGGRRLVSLRPGAVRCPGQARGDLLRVAGLVERRQGCAAACAESWITGRPTERATPYYRRVRRRARQYGQLAQRRRPRPRHRKGAITAAAV